MIDYQPRIGVSRRQLPGLAEASRTRQIDRQGMLCRHGQDTVDGRVGGIGRNIVSQKDPDADRPLVPAQSAMVLATAGSVGSTGLTSPNRSGCAL